ncbi:hypothetical protein [Vagococcus sp. WN89Y]|uniref:hypothetical protein n=1 Tax=Vagococcus sp. WN89Y TaxID=3457258 RepID=UPI003FCCEFE3
MGDIRKISVKQGVGDLPAPFLLSVAAVWRQRIARIGDKKVLSHFGAAKKSLLAQASDLIMLVSWLAG